MVTQAAAVEDYASQETGWQYIEYLKNHADIFADLVAGSAFDFVLYRALEDYDSSSIPLFAFHVARTEDGIEVVPGKAPDPDLKLVLSLSAVQKLVQSPTKAVYAKQFGTFYNDPDVDAGWIDFIPIKGIKSLISLGYGKFAEETGIVENEN
ncbi:MAG TPA: hypothetical protein VKK79_10970 [Candidatus Lokiarchaeia archaeon]|nr:hypothetical protein [Candidatus Lokiarchaeia archaeon]